MRRRALPALLGALARERFVSDLAVGDPALLRAPAGGGAAASSGTTTKINSKVCFRVPSVGVNSGSFRGWAQACVDPLQLENPRTPIGYAVNASLRRP